jgi:putative iron-only hydrogenase system regulator
MKLEVKLLDKRLGVIGIIVNDIENSKEVNDVLHNFSNIIVGRMGIPYKERKVSVISLIVDGSMDDISAMTGKLGNIKNISVKAAISKK